MRSATRAFSTLLVTIALVGCGGDEGNGKGGGNGAGGGSKQDQAKAVVVQLFDLVKAGNFEGAADLVAYRGSKDKKRRWTDSSNYANEEEKRYVDSVCKRIEFLQMKGAPSFEKFESETESQGEWLVWHVRFGEGDEAKKAAFACINNAGKTLLGDID